MGFIKDLKKAFKKIFKTKKTTKKNYKRNNYQQKQSTYKKVEVSSDVQYEAKGSIMSECEKKYYSVIEEIIGTEYRIQPQINLATIIERTDMHKYQNELFRNIDFGIFDKNFNLILLIEINDKSHEQQDRRERDDKVKTICEKANIPLIRFWTKYGVNTKYIKEQLAKYIKL